MKILILFILLYSAISAADFTLTFDGDSSISTSETAMSLYGIVTNNSDEALKLTVIKHTTQSNFITTVCVSEKCFMPTLDTVNALVDAGATSAIKINVDCINTCTGTVTVIAQDYENPTDSKSLSYTFTKEESVAIVDIKTVNRVEMRAYPNPFNPTTNIAFNMPVSSKASVKVYDIRGRQVATLVNGYITQGSHIATFNASQLPSGVYFAKLAYGSVVTTQKLLLVK